MNADKQILSLDELYRIGDRILARQWPIAALLVLFGILYSGGLSAHGMFMWDEPEYASIARSMVRGEGFSISGRPNSLRPPMLPLAGALSAVAVAFALLVLLCVYGLQSHYSWLRCRSWRLGAGFLNAIHRAGVHAVDRVVPYVYAIDAGLHDRADYSQVVKVYSKQEEGRERYSPGAFVSVEKKEIFGAPNMASASTSHVERKNGTLRQWCKRLTRLT